MRHLVGESLHLVWRQADAVVDDDVVSRRHRALPHVLGDQEEIVPVGGERERNVLFNDALNTFYLRLYGVGHMVNDHSDSEKGEREKCFI